MFSRQKNVCPLVRIWSKLHRVSAFPSTFWRKMLRERSHPLQEFLSHVQILPGMESSAGRRLLFAGVVGVSFFFVLSGFVLPYNCVDVFRNHTDGRLQEIIWDRLTKMTGFTS
jgi:hypothetical protein